MTTNLLGQYYYRTTTVLPYNYTITGVQVHHYNNASPILLQVLLQHDYSTTTVVVQECCYTIHCYHNTINSTDTVLLLQYHVNTTTVILLQLHYEYY